MLQSSSELAFFVEQLPVAIAIFDGEMRFLAVSQPFLSDLAQLTSAKAVPPAEAIGHSVYEVFPQFPMHLREVHVRALAGETLTQREERVRRQDGHTDWVRWLAKPWRTADGRIGGAMVFGEIITEQIEAKHACEKSEERFRATFENTAVGIALVAPDLQWSRVNNALSRIIGWPANDIVTMSLRDVCHPDDFAEDLRQMEQIRRGQIDSYVIDKRYLRKDGSITWARVTVSGVRKSDGTLDYFIRVIEDISPYKRAEELLQRQAHLLDLSHDAIFTWKMGGGITYWNRGAEALYGYPREEAIGRRSHGLLRTRAHISTQKIEAQIARDGSWYGELTHTTRDGRKIVVESRHVGVFYDGELYALETNRDITARKSAEEALRKSEERFRSSIVQSPVPTILFDDREQMLAISQSWLKAARVSAGEIHRMEDWTIRAYGERSDEILEVIRGIIATEPEAWLDEQTVLTGSGDKRVWNFCTSGLGTLSDGRRLFISVAQDVTDQKAYEERIHLLMREARHRTKNILGLVQAIARQTAAGGDAQDFIGRFTERVRALAANQDLLVRHEWRRIDVKELVRDQLGHFADLIGTRINFKGPKLHLNAAAAQAIGLALHELATNAGKYGALSTDAGHVDVRWQLDGDTFEMSWIERNGPPVRPPERQGFGTTVTEAMVKQALGGEVQLDYARSGLEWHMTCHATCALEGEG